MPDVDRRPGRGGRCSDFHRGIEAGVAGARAWRVRHPLGRRHHPGHAAVGSARWRRWCSSSRTTARTWAATAPSHGVSATPLETDDRQPAYQPMYSSEKHGALQIAEAVQTQLRGILTAGPLDRVPGGTGVRLEADELLTEGESLSVRALPDAAGLTLRATVTDLATGGVGGRSPCSRDADEVHTGDLPPLPAGDYRLRVAASTTRRRWSTRCTAGVRGRRRRARRDVALTAPSPLSSPSTPTAADHPAVRVPQRPGRAAHLPRGPVRRRDTACRCSRTRRRGMRGRPRSASTSCPPAR